MLVKELYLDSLLNEESALAHLIHHLLSERKVSLEDDISMLDKAQVDREKVAEMIHRNVLGFRKIHMYSLKMSKTTFVFIFAANKQEAIQYFSKTFHQRPLNCCEYLLEYEFARGNEITTFREMKRDHEKFPTIAGYYEKI